MSEVKVFHDITPSIFVCVKAAPKLPYRTKYVPADADKGSASITIIGTHFPAQDIQFDVNFEFDPARGDLSYTFVKKSLDVPVSVLWSALENVVESCRKS
jgi:hypothetical protein